MSHLCKIKIIFPTEEKDTKNKTTRKPNKIPPTTTTTKKWTKMIIQ